MRLKNWLRRSVLACAGSLAAAAWAGPQTAAGKKPAVALIDAADAEWWKGFVKEQGWEVIVPPAGATAIDLRVQALVKAVQEAIASSAVDPARVYVSGRGEAAGAVFYTVSRVPDLWAAGIAVGGSPQPAIDTGRIFAANFKNAPVLWIGAGAMDPETAKRLKAADMNLEFRAAAATKNGDAISWLLEHRREDFPAEIDCETNSPAFASCYWIQMSKFDPNERNDVLPTTALAPGSGARLELGDFGYKTDDPGPGILISVLPEKYSGPLKVGDRIVALDGKPLENAKQFADILAKATEERPIVAAVQRGKERLRLETRIVLPKRDAAVTARVEAQYVAAEKEVQIVSRTVKEMRVTIPAHWAQGGRLYWNGLSMEKIDAPGCFLLTIEKEILHASPCGK